MTAGWYPDPSGRFPQRYFDGHSWTDQVVGANGMATTDPIAGAAGAALPAPTSSTALATTPSDVWAPPGGSSPPVVGAANRSTSRRLSWFGLAVATVGTVLAGLSVTALDWASDVSFGDLRDVSDGLESESTVNELAAYHYGSWGWALVLLLVVTGLVLAASVVRRRDGTMLRVVVAVVAAAGVLVHAVYVATMFEGGGPSPDLGAWAGSIGYLITIVGLSIATPRQRSRA